MPSPVDVVPRRQFRAKDFRYPISSVAWAGQTWHKAANEMGSASDTPLSVQELASACVQYVQTAMGFSLDFHEDTLPILDHYLRSVEFHSEAIRTLVAQAAGAYFGQVVRSIYPARWYAPDDDRDAWRIEFEPCFLYFSPTAFAHEAILGREVSETSPGFGMQAGDIPTLKAALDLMGTVSAEDFYKLSTRFEVLTVVVDRLVADAMSREGELVALSHDVYAAALDVDSLAPS